MVTFNSAGRNAINDYMVENAALREQVRVLTQALEKYADETRWIIRGNDFAIFKAVHGHGIAQRALTTPTNAETTEDKNGS